jgi:hypothetical protein
LSLFQATSPSLVFPECTQNTRRDEKLKSLRESGERLTVKEKNAINAKYTNILKEWRKRRRMVSDRRRDGASKSGAVSVCASIPCLLPLLKSRVNTPSSQAKDILDQILEGYPKPKEKLFVSVAVDGFRRDAARRFRHAVHHARASPIHHPGGNRHLHRRGKRRRHKRL